MAPLIARILSAGSPVLRCATAAATTLSCITNTQSCCCSLRCSLTLCFVSQPESNQIKVQRGLPGEELGSWAGNRRHGRSGYTEADQPDMELVLHGCVCATKYNRPGAVLCPAAMHTAELSSLLKWDKHIQTASGEGSQCHAGWAAAGHVHP